MKKIISFLTLSTLFLGLAVGVQANNHGDTKWSATLPRFQGNWYTSSREKQDASSGYVHLDSIGKGGMNAWMQLANGVWSPDSI